MAPPSGKLSSTRYTIIVDAGSSGSRLIIYSYQDPEAEREEIVNTIRRKYKNGYTGGTNNAQDAGKRREREKREMEKSLRRLVKVEKGASGDDWMKKAEPGISSMSPGNMPQYLSPLLTHAMEHIPPSQHANTPIYILATAGMRLLEPERRNAILAATCDTLRKDYPFSVGASNDLGPCGDSVRVVSGEEEGMWGWVAVNYLMDGFGHSAAQDPEEEHSILPLPDLQRETQGSLEKGVSPTLVDVNHRHPTFGFLDMGGASTQIAFSPSVGELERSKFPADELKSVSLRLLSGQAVEWPLFVASWLGFGTNQVRERYIARKVSEWQRENERLSKSIELSGGSVPTSVSAGFFKPIEDPCLPNGLKLPPTSPSMPAFVGTGSFSQCLESLQPLLDTSAPCPPPAEHCLFAGLPTPHIDFEREDQRGFIGISEYWYTAQQILGLGGVWDWAEWERGMEGFCQRNWADIKHGFQAEHGLDGTAVDISRLEMQCFKGAWISNVLHDGIGIPRITDAQGDQTLTGEKGGELVDEAARRAKEKGLVSKKHSHFQSVDTIGETAVSWTLGKMVIEASKSVKPHGHVPQPVGTHSKWSQAWTVGRGRVHHALGLPKLESKMDELGLDVFWVFFAVTLIVVGLAYTVLRRRFWLTKASLFNSKRRKRSDAADVRDWMRRRSQTASSSVEEGLLPSSPKTLWSGTSRLKPYVHKISTLVAKVTHSNKRERTARPTWNRQASSPNVGHIEMPERSEVYSTATSMSLPGSPKAHESFFIPAHSEATPAPVNSLADKLEFTPRSASKMPLQMMSDGSRSLSAKSSPGGLRSKRTSPLPMTSANVESTGTGGWNDPPGGVFGPADATGHLLGSKSLSSLSRSSSRINLEEYAGSLAVRPISRGPGGDDPGGP